MFLLFVILLKFTTLNTSVGNQTKLCIQSYPNLRVMCATAYERRISFNERKCHDLCLKKFAQTCQYNKIRMECELYDIVVALQRKHSGKEDTFPEDHIISMEIGIVQESNNFVMKSCVPSITPAIGFLLLLNDGCNLKVSDHLNKNLISKQQTFVTSGDNGVTMVNIQRKSPVLDCTFNFSTYIEVINGIQIVSDSIATFQTRTLEVCMHTCMKNKLNSKSLFLVECYSAQYNRISKRCSLFNTSIAPTGNAEYIPNKDMIYFEKICISDLFRSKCSVILNRVPQYILVGHATAVIDALSHNYCIEMCLRSMEMLNFTCHSAIHFHEYSKSNCILNKHSAKTRPEYFVNEEKQKLDYIEIDKCLNPDMLDYN